MAMLRVHLMQNWFGYSDPAMEEALYETTILRQFSALRLERIPDETTILLLLAAALTNSTENAVFCTRRSAKSRRPRPWFAPRSSIRFGSSNASLAMKKCAFGGLTKNTAHRVALFALSNLWRARRYLLATAGEVRV